MKSEESIDRIIFKCSNYISVDGSILKKKICGRKFTVRRYSWFSKSHLKMPEILSLTYYWWNNLPLTFIEHELDLEFEIIPHISCTILYYIYTRLIIILDLYLYYTYTIK
jgi:hypothetical protein